MERKAELAMLALSIRVNTRQINGVLEELNGGHREQTFPKTLVRCFRTIEHDARVVRLNKLGDLAASAKEASQHVLDLRRGGALVELLASVTAELNHVADAVEAGTQHRLDPALLDRVQDAARADA